MRKLPKSIRPEEFKELIKAIPGRNIRFKVAALLAYGSGLRISEVLKLTEQDFNKNSIQINESKGGVDRIVPIPKGWRKWMFAYLPINRSSRALQHSMKNYCAKAKLNPQYTFHSLRHGFATRLLENGVPINQVQVLLGHNNIVTTSIYTLARPIDALQNYEELF